MCRNFVNAGKTYGNIVNDEDMADMKRDKRAYSFLVRDGYSTDVPMLCYVNRSYFQVHYYAWLGF